jgi:AcrR family transcriptional regulator
MKVKGFVRKTSNFDRPFNQKLRALSPRTKEQIEEIRDEKKTLIMDVALEHFAGEGYYLTTINHIAKHAGISKGLMYNYFESKEALLLEIIHRSIKEAYSYFDINNDGFLTEEEFEFFVRRISLMYREKKAFWQLFVQLLMQKEVRETFTKFFLESPSSEKTLINVKPGLLVTDVMNIITDYFIRKKERKGPDYDALLDLNMFIITIKGFAITYIYLDDINDEYYEKSIEKIIELYK